MSFRRPVPAGPTQRARNGYRMTFVPVRSASECHRVPMENSDSDRILVGVDGSASSVAALRHAARLSEAFDAPLEAVIFWSYPPYAEEGTVFQWSPEDDATSILDKTVDDAFGADAPERFSRSVRPGSPAHGLIEMSDSYGMLVLGSRGRGGFTGLLLGSVSAACAAHAHCPVLVVHDHTAQSQSTAA